MKKLILLSILLIVGCEETLEPEDCAGVAGGTSWESDCGCVSYTNSGDDCDDICGLPFGINSSCTGCFDSQSYNYCSDCCEY